MSGHWEGWFVWKITPQTGLVLCEEMSANDIMIVFVSSASIVWTTSPIWPMGWSKQRWLPLSLCPKRIGGLVGCMLHFIQQFPTCAHIDNCHNGVLYFVLLLLFIWDIWLCNSHAGRGNHLCNLQAYTIGNNVFHYYHSYNFIIHTTVLFNTKFINKTWFNTDQ